MPTVLIMGASRGLGLEFAQQYADAGWRVIATHRDAAGKKTLKGIKNVEPHTLDVTDHAAIEDLARSLKSEAIDLLLNVAGIYGPRPALLGSIDYDALGRRLPGQRHGAAENQCLFRRPCGAQ